jgi:hypothetical protein
MLYRQAALDGIRCQSDKSRSSTSVRKLKALGLTESLEIGYRLSPHGEALLASRLAGA